MIQDQHTATIDLVEAKQINGMDGLPLAIFLEVIDFGIPVDLRDSFLYVLVVVV